MVRGLSSKYDVIIKPQCHRCIKKTLSEKTIKLSLVQFKMTNLKFKSIVIRIWNDYSNQFKLI